MQPFHLTSCELEGVNLVEASAGTGKTYALAGLFLRLIVEKKLSVQQILAITFTKAATAELKRRIRRLLCLALDSFRCGEKAAAEDISVIKSLLEKYPTQKERDEICRQLAMAIAGFDEVAIYTIHGFCQRILTENAFECGMLFDVEFIASQRRLENEFVGDFWRSSFYNANPALLKYALSQGVNKDYFLKLLSTAVLKSELKILPNVKSPTEIELKESLDALKKLFDRFRIMWRAERDGIARLIEGKALSGVYFGKKSEKIVLEIDEIVSNTETPVELENSVRKLSQSYLKEKTNKNSKTPEHPLFVLAQDLCEQAAKVEETQRLMLICLKKKFLESLREDFLAYKIRKNVFFYDDLLLRADNALQGDQGENLAAILRKKYKALLIDEFQDTDLLQFAVVSSVFLPVREKNSNIIFYVGDPKQSIYSFRGADIFAYLRASERVDRKYTMITNWRSEAGLVKAINALFQTQPQPFVYRQIDFVPVEAASEAKIPVLQIADDNQASLQWWFLPGSEDNNQPVGIIKARRKITSAVVAEIVKLLKLGQSSKAFIGNEPVRANDIAVLVRKNSEAISFQKLLTEAGVPVVLLSTQSVFSAPEAEEFKRFLCGLIHYEDKGYLLAALTTPFFNLTAQDLANYGDESPEMEVWYNKFRHYHELWMAGGFLAMFYSFLEKEQIRSSIVLRRFAERRLTNYLHLAQELHKAEREGKFNMLQSLQWLEGRRSSEEDVAENEQLRLATDQEGVRLITIHKSKGLEFPIVFCPFAWEGDITNEKHKPAYFHDEDHNWQMTLDLGSNELSDNYEKLVKEELAESCRMLYVALTRAKNRCYFVWGKINKTERSAPTYLFHQETSALPKDIRSLSNEDMLAQLSSVVEQARDNINLQRMKMPASPESFSRKNESINIVERKFTGKIDSSWKIASFTYFTNVKLSYAEETIWESEDEVLSKKISPDNSAAAASMLNFPPGIVSGNMLHKLIEEIDFCNASDSALKSAISENLLKYGISEIWQPVIIELVKNIGAVRLGSPVFGQFSLNCANKDKYIKEMGFYFPLAGINSQAIIEVLKKSEFGKNTGWCISELQKLLNFPFTRGYLKGFIDLICEFNGYFYVIDWKSNYLGESYDLYSPASLQVMMSKSVYVLQYLIYTVALNRYLKKRIKNYCYEKNFGGIHYVFLRGLRACDLENGIYYNRPDYGLIRQLDNLLVGDNAI